MSREVLTEYLMLSLPMVGKKLFKGMHKEYRGHQFRLLHMLKNQGEKPMKFYGEKLMVSKPNMSTLVDRLVEDGLIERVHDINDRRVINIKLSKTGELKLKQHEEEVKTGVMEKLAVLSDEEVVELTKSFASINKIFKKIQE